MRIPCLHLRYPAFPTLLLQPRRLALWQGLSRLAISTDNLNNQHTRNVLNID
jgi:hypothetical protein